MNIDIFNYLLYNQYVQTGGKNNNEIKWNTFEHNGVLFPDPYIPHKIPLIYEGKKIVLDPESEEYASIYAKFTETDYVKNKIFRKNFFNDWKIFLKKGGFNDIKDIDKCDFSLILENIIKTREKTKNLSKEEKDKLKKEKDKIEEKYKFAKVNGTNEPVGNFRIEPPGIFLGRGCHPKAGEIKHRVYPEDITINIDKKSKIPELPNFYKNRKWGHIIHNEHIEWVASWKDNITGKTKYVWLGQKSLFKAKSDEHKFDIARKLNKHIAHIRQTNYNNIISDSTDNKTKQLGCALYLIDKLALRVGNEKGDDEADTVGVCSLRVEHINLLDNNKIKLDFLGKDSIRYEKIVEIDSNVYNQIMRFMKNKKKTDDIFDEINPTLLNNYLKSMMEDLTAKVFRTYNASILFQNELNDIQKQINIIVSNRNSKETKETKETKNENDRILETSELNAVLDLYQKANIKVALLCNHQKGVSKTFNEQIVKMNEKIKELKNKKKELKDNINSSNKEKNKEKIIKIEEKILREISKKDIKVELKNLSLTTSKMNYIDPRITIAFFKKNDLPLDKIFSPTLMDKFFWAMDVPKTWHF
jgi:DNA topoisomerase I